MTLVAAQNMTTESTATTTKKSGEGDKSGGPLGELLKLIEDLLNGLLKPDELLGKLLGPKGLLGGLL